MVRTMIAAIAMLILATPAVAKSEVWMVKSSGVLGCGALAKAIEFNSSEMNSGARSRDLASAESSGCVVLNSGERLLDQSEASAGFNEYVRVQRHDGSMIYVLGSAIARDPGCGSIDEDRKE